VRAKYIWPLPSMLAPFENASRSIKMMRKVDMNDD